MYAGAYVYAIITCVYAGACGGTYVYVDACLYIYMCVCVRERARVCT